MQVPDGAVAKPRHVKNTAKGTLSSTNRIVLLLATHVVGSCFTMGVLVKVASRVQPGIASEVVEHMDLWIVSRL